MNPDIHVESSEKGFTNDEIAVKWLHHFIEHSNSGPTSDWKLLLMDNHGSYVIPWECLLISTLCLM